MGNVANIIRRTAYEFDSDIPQAGHYIRKAAAQLENVSDAIGGEVELLVGRADAVGQARTIEALYHSAATGAPVELAAAAVP